MKKNILYLAAALCLISGVAMATGNELAYKRIMELDSLSAASIGTGDYLPVWDASAKKTKRVPANNFSTTASTTLQGRATIWICGDATTVNNNTVYYGPSQTVVAGSGRTCTITAAGNTTEATADTPAFPNDFQVLSWYCLQPDAGANLTYTLRANAAAMVPAQTLTIVDNDLHGANNVGTTTAIAANSPIAIAVSSTSDVGTAQWACAVNVAF
jgi:hypothetical protein